MYSKSTFSHDEIIQNFYSVKERIKVAAQSVGRDMNDINLIVVTKTFDSSEILPLIMLGHRDFGENRVQEAEHKWIDLKKSNDEINLHLIGHLQTNKVKKALEIFNTIHTLDSQKIVIEVTKHINEPSVVTKEFFIELNLGDEPQKYGLAQDEISDLIQQKRYFDKIDFNGLMCIPPYEEEPSPYFALLKKIADKFQIKYLSMGMSSDFEKAVQFGATHVRVGSEIFGSRS